MVSQLLLFSIFCCYSCYVYSYNINNTSVESQTRGKLGDATKEATTTLGTLEGGWGGVSRYMPYNNVSWMLRGGAASSSAYLGLLNLYGSYGGNNYGYGTRPVLVISRELPWLSE